ncbi:MAG: 3-oxoacyl-ACP reductase FabG [Dehalococcoidia bacterium]|nr:3-oxoacyl-ACP reductase FabG [Dehalococcoidia bacterium]
MGTRDRVAIVTGGAGGIGRAICLLLARQGTKVLVADIVFEEASKVVDEIKTMGGQATAMKVDVKDLDQAYGMAKFAMDSFGQIDILVNVAGGTSGPVIKTKPRPFAKSDKERWDEMIALNLFSAFNCTRSVIGHMMDRRSGRIVNLSSISGVNGSENNAEYSAAKAGIIGFTKAVAKEVARYGITVNSVAPGLTGTARYLSYPKDARETWESGIAVGRVGRPEEIAAAVLFLASDEASYITGQNILVDGCMRTPGQ